MQLPGASVDLEFHVVAIILLDTSMDLFYGNVAVIYGKLFIPIMS